MRTLTEITTDAELIDDGRIEPLFTFDPEATHEDALEELLV